MHQSRRNKLGITIKTVENSDCSKLSNNTVYKADRCHQKMQIKLFIFISLQSKARISLGKVLIYLLGLCSSSMHESQAERDNSLDAPRELSPHRSPIPIKPRNGDDWISTFISLHVCLSVCLPRRKMKDFASLCWDTIAQWLRDAFSTDEAHRLD